MLTVLGTLLAPVLLRLPIVAKVSALMGGTCQLLMNGLMLLQNFLIVVVQVLRVGQQHLNGLLYSPDS
jgi:hypothetical protein